MSDCQFFVFWTGAFFSYLALYTRHIGLDLLAASLGGALLLHIYVVGHSTFISIRHRHNNRKIKKSDD